MQYNTHATDVRQSGIHPDRESASAAAEKGNLGGHRTDKPSEGYGNARSCESRSRNRSGVVSSGSALRKSREGNGGGATA